MRDFVSLITSEVIFGLWVRIIDTPLIIDSISAIAVPVFRSVGFSFPSIFPIKDLFEMEIKIGKFVFRSFNFLIISMSR